MEQNAYSSMANQWKGWTRSICLDQKVKEVQKYTDVHRNMNKINCTRWHSYNTFLSTITNCFLHMNFHAVSSWIWWFCNSRYFIIIILNELVIIITIFSVAYDRIRLWFATTTADYNSNPFFHSSKPADPIVGDLLTALTVRAYKCCFVQAKRTCHLLTTK